MPTKRRRRRKCAICGKPLPLPRKVRSPGPPAVYCSDECREAAKFCTVPGCTTRRSGGKVCTYHKQRPENDYCNAYCKLCGYGPRVKLYIHVNREHDGTKAYAEQFGQEALVSEGYRALRRTIYEQSTGVETDANGRRRRFSEPTGLPVASPRRLRVCRNGHALRGRNVMISINIVKGKEYTLRQCRKCWYAWHNAYRRKKRKQNAPAWRRTKRRCDHCGRFFTVTHARQRFCCREHKAAYHNARRKRLASGE